MIMDFRGVVTSVYGVRGFANRVDGLSSQHRDSGVGCHLQRDVGQRFGVGKATDLAWHDLRLCSEPDGEHRVI